MLWRALKHVEKGFYIDVGANDPLIDSVTLAFYQRGWRGINIEPVPQYYERLCAERPADINLQLAVGETEGELTLFDVPDTGLSTVDVDIGSVYKASGKEIVQRTVRVLPLAQICEEHVREAIHFLKIDVEGFEKAVVRGMDFRQWRPWVVVIEATKPQSGITSHEAWEDIVLQAGYQFAYFDGLNHYYVAAEHAELMPAFQLPPNYFDHFRLRAGHAFSYPTSDGEEKVWQAESRAQQAEARAEHAEMQKQQAQAHADRLEMQMQQTVSHAQQAQRALAESQAHAIHVEAVLAQANNQLSLVYQSTSWRITRPLRVANRLVVTPRRESAILLSAAKSGLKNLIRRSLSRVAQDRRLRTLIITHLGRFPTLERKARAFYFRAMKSQPASRDSGRIEVPHTLKKLPVSARKVLADIHRILNK